MHLHPPTEQRKSLELLVITLWSTQSDFLHLRTYPTRDACCTQTPGAVRIEFLFDAFSQWCSGYTLASVLKQFIYYHSPLKDLIYYTWLVNIFSRRVRVGDGRGSSWVSAVACAIILERSIAYSYSLVKHSRRCSVRKKDFNMCRYQVCWNYIPFRANLSRTRQWYSFGVSSCLSEALRCYAPSLMTDALNQISLTTILAPSVWAPLQLFLSRVTYIKAI